MVPFDIYHLDCMHLFFYDRRKILFIDIVFDGYRLQICSNFLLPLHHTIFAPFARQKVKCCCFYSFTAAAQFTCGWALCVVSVKWIRLAWNKAVKWTTNESCHVKCIRGKCHSFFQWLTWSTHSQWNTWNAWVYVWCFVNSLNPFHYIYINELCKETGITTHNLHPSVVLCLSFIFLFGWWWNFHQKKWS